MQRLLSLRHQHQHMEVVAQSVRASVCGTEGRGFETPHPPIIQEATRNALPLFFICNWLGGALSGPKRPIFRHTSQIFVDRSEATANKNPLRLAKNGHFFVSDATTLTSYFYLFPLNHSN
jgi:hypothetical protein